MEDRLLLSSVAPGPTPNHPVVVTFAPSHLLYHAGNGSARALEVGRRTMSSGWTADLRTDRECDAGNIMVHMNAL